MPRRRKKNQNVNEPSFRYDDRYGERKPVDYSALRRSAKEVKKFAVWTKAASVISLCLVGVVAVTYLGSFLYDRFGAFTVSVKKYDMVSQGLSLSETGEFIAPIPRLTADGVREITNISGDSLPKDIDSVDGSHNGANYIAYSFYIKNVGEETLTYEYSVLLSNVTQNVDRAIRIRVYQNGQPVDYARTKTDGSGPERGTTAFPTATAACIERRYDFEKNDVDRYTVVIWLEGDDPDCVDDVIGGQLKMEMQFSIVEGA